MFIPDHICGQDINSSVVQQEPFVFFKPNLLVGFRSKKEPMLAIHKIPSTFIAKEMEIEMGLNTNEMNLRQGCWTYSTLVIHYNN